MARRDFYRRLQRQLKDEEEAHAEEDAFHELVVITNDHMEKKGPKAGGSRPGKRPNINRERHIGAERVMKDYFGDNPVYDDRLFRRRYRMSRQLFLKIHNDVVSHDSYFLQKPDATGLLGLSSLQKLTAAIRQLAYGIGADATDEYCRIAETTATTCLYRFCKAVRRLYEAKYLRKPGRTDIQRLIEVNEKRGFPGMVGSIDCMHYVWDNCPVAWHSQFRDKDGKSSIVLEAIADEELWIWHAFFGLPGVNNDINVLERSPLGLDLIDFKLHDVSFQVNGNEYRQPYLLADSIYPNWTCFVKTIQTPQSDKRSYFAKRQESCRKDVERAFGVLQMKWGIIRQPARSWHIQNITDILMSCVILHNMGIEDERGQGLEELSSNVPRAEVTRSSRLPWNDFLMENADLKSSSGHYTLKNDLVHHLWQMRDMIE
jgi:hypothetical protein